MVTKSTIGTAQPTPTVIVTGSMMTTEKSATYDNSSVLVIALPITAAVVIIIIALITLSIVTLYRVKMHRKFQ